MSEVKKGAILSYLSILLNIVVAIIYTPFFIRTLGQSDYGLYNLVIAFMAYISILDLGFGNTVQRILSENRVTGSKIKEQNIINNIFTWYALVSIIVFIVGIVTFQNIETIFQELTTKEIHDLKIMTILVLIFILVQFLPGIFNGVLLAYEHFAIAKSMLLIRIALPPLVAIPFLLNGYGAITIIALTIGIHISVQILGAYLCYKKVPIKLRLTNVFKKETRRKQKTVNEYLILILLSIAVEIITLNTGQLILGVVSGTMAVAVFAIAVQFVKIYQQFATSIYNVTFPTFTKLVAKNATKDELLSQVIKVSKFQLVSLSFILSGFIIFGKKFIEIWAGPDFTDAYIMTIILMAAITIQLCQLPFVSIIQSYNKQKFRLTVLITTLLLMLVSSMILAQHSGGLGVTLSIAIFCYVMYSIVMNVYYNKTLKLDTKRFAIEMIKTITPIAVFTITYYGFYHYLLEGDITLIRIVIHIALFTLLFAVISWLFLLKRQDKERIKLKLNGVFS